MVRVWYASGTGSVFVRDASGTALVRIWACLVRHLVRGPSQNLTWYMSGTRLVRSPFRFLDPSLIEQENAYVPVCSIVRCVQGGLRAMYIFYTLLQPTSSRAIKPYTDATCKFTGASSRATKDPKLPIIATDIVQIIRKR